MLVGLFSTNCLFLPQGPLLGPGNFFRRPLPDDPPEVVGLRRRGARQTPSQRTKSSESGQTSGQY